jgi:hypothetical protein
LIISLNGYHSDVRPGTPPQAILVTMNRLNINYLADQSPMTL